MRKAKAIGMRGLALLAALALSGCGGGAVKRLYGSGSTFIKPLMDKWVDVYERGQREVEINYQGTGSAAGIRELIDGAVDFACTDVFLDPDQLREARDSKLGGDIVQVPLVLGAIVPAYNLPGIDRPLRFTGEVLADIFLGRIRTWNDSALVALNPGVPLPALDISVVHRSEGSGSTFVFSEYLSKVSPEWRSRVGVGAAISWPVGIGELGNPGVAGFIDHTPGSIGYLELYFALLKKDDITFGSVRNKAGRFVRAELASVRAAAENALRNRAEERRFSLTNVEGADSYPIAGTTWALLRTDAQGEGDAAAIDFLFWATHEGQKYTENMHYASLPSALVGRIEETLRKIKK